MESSVNSGRTIKGMTYTSSIPQNVIVVLERKSKPLVILPSARNNYLVIFSTV